MRYLTARKRAEGKGAAGTGTEHFWYMKLSGVGLALIIPVFLVAFGRALGGDHDRGLQPRQHTPGPDYCRDRSKLRADRHRAFRPRQDRAVRT